MKKFFYVLMAAAALVAVSCEKNPNGENNNEGENNTPEVRKVLVHLASHYDETTGPYGGRIFRYDEAGKLVGVDETWLNDDGSTGVWNLDVEYADNKVIFKEQESGNVDREWTVGANGYVSSVTKGEKVYTYSYDNDGHLVEIKENGETCSIITWENGNLVSWSKEKELKDEAGNYTIARIKAQTYTTQENVGGVHIVFSEKSSLSQWMYETGLFGKASKNLVATDQWTDSETGATFDYRYDEDDYVVASFKYYGEKLDDEKYFVWK